MKPSEVVAIVSASPESRDAEWASRLPEIPTSTGVFWPSVWTGIACTLFGLYLIVTPLARTQKTKSSNPVSPVPVVESTTRSPSAALRTLRCGFVDSKDSTFALAMEAFAKNVRTRTNSDLNVELFPGGLVDGVQMDERELVEAVRKGTLSMSLSTTSPLTNFNHLLDVFDLPFLVTDEDHADRIIEGPVGQQLLTSLSDKNLVGLAYFEVGFRIFSSSIPLPDYAAFKGKKLRVMQSVTFTRFIKAIGGDPVPSPVDKIYLMGKEGYIDGADRTYPTYWDFHLYDVHKYISETRHAYSVKMVLINSEVFKSLTPEERDVLQQSAVEAARFQRTKQREADKAVKELAIKEGIKVFEFPPSERKKFVNASGELYEEYRQNQSRDILDSIEQLTDEPQP